LEEVEEGTRLGGQVAAAVEQGQVEGKGFGVEAVAAQLAAANGFVAEEGRQFHIAQTTAGGLQAHLWVVELDAPGYRHRLHGGAGPKAPAPLAGLGEA